MKKILFLSVAVAMSAIVSAQKQPRMLLRYDKPATYFEESLPIGNGKLGALVYGGTDTCTIHLNDITLWTGKPVDNSSHTNASEWIPKIREALFNEDYAAADSLQLHVQGPNSQFYQPLGTLQIKDLNEGEVTRYRRTLSLERATVREQYVKDGKRMRREYFVSHPDHVMAVRLQGDVNVKLWLTGKTPHQATAANKRITMTGHATGDPLESIHFCTILKVRTDGKVTSEDSTLTITGGKSAVILLVNETSFNGADKHPVTEGLPYMSNAVDCMAQTDDSSFDDLLARHVRDYRKYYKRVELTLGDTDSTDLQMTTDSLLRRGNSRYLEALYFQFGRYLLISSSRTPGVPANLQGLWSPHLWSPWRGNYTMNINLEENYWPAFTANLAEMATPLDKFIESLSENGSHTAKDYYGVGTGWCASHNSDIWAMTNPVGEQKDKPEWANWNMGGAWLVNTLWERFEFTQDSLYLLSTALPKLIGAAMFCQEWLIPNPNNPKELITAPSTSPENEYVTDKGYHGMTCYGSTADMSIMRELFENTRKAINVAADYLSKYDSEETRDFTIKMRGLQAIIATTMLRLHPYIVGKDGDLNEWYHDWEDKDPRHRHQSHLIGLYPGQHYLRLQHLPDNIVLAIPNQLSKEDYLRACEQTLKQKGDDTTGWSTGWRINLWARLRNGEQAYHIYRKLLSFVTPDDYHGPDRRHAGGTYPNLFDAHPPFQIDGNFGGTAGVCEMLIQSQLSTNRGEPAVITLLPALPEAWSKGHVKGLCARGGFVVDMTWEDSKVTSATIHAIHDGTARIEYNGTSQTLTLRKGQTHTIQ